jgi:hypothetical protein
MTKYRCTIIRVDAAGEWVASIGAALALLPDFACIGGESADAACADLDAVVLAGSPVSLRKLLEHIARLRREHPDCAVLVAGEGFDAGQRGRIRRAGS